MDTGLISVQHGLKWNRKGGGYELGELKTANSSRCIKLSATTLQALAKHRVAQHQERLALGNAYQNNGFVFTTTIGTPLEPRNVIARHLKPILCKAFCDKEYETGPHKVDIRWYDLRHTMASLLLAQGVNPKIVAERLGDSVEITLSVYAHLIPSMQNDAALALEKALA